MSKALLMFEFQSLPVIVAVKEAMARLGAEVIPVQPRDYNKTLESLLDGTAEGADYAGAPLGGSMLVLGGTHPNEPSGLVSAILLIENAVPEEGTLYVIPRTNNSAMTCTDPQEGSPMRFTIDTELERIIVPDSFFNQIDKMNQVLVENGAADKKIDYVQYINEAIEKAKKNAPVRKSDVKSLK